MNWISLLSQIFFGIVVTSITGSVMLTIWFLCRLLLQKWNPHLVYYMLRWVVVMFLLPITFVAILLNYKTGYVQWADGIPKMMFVLDLNNRMFQGFAVVWLIVTPIICGIFLRDGMVQHRICKWNFEDGSSLAQTEFERIKKVLGVKGRVTLLRNDYPNLKSPFTKGIWNRKVIIPYLDYSEEELKVILYHELNHIRKSDTFFRYLTMLAVVVNSINPISYFLVGLVTDCSESDCDARAVEELEKEGISKKRYYHVIMDLIVSDTNERQLFIFPMLFDKKKRIYRRMDFMENYRMNWKKMTKPVTFALTLMFALLSSVSAYAAGVEVAEASDEQFKDVQNVRNEGELYENTGWSDETIIPPSDVVDIVYINDGIMLLSGSTFDWSVPAGTRYVTSSIYMAKDTVVQIATTASPSNLTYWMGLMYPDNSCAIVEGSGQGSHAFTVPSSGYYRIMVENRSSQVINVRGSYTY